MNILKKGYFTSEFYSSLILIILITMVNIYFNLNDYYFYSISIVVSGYIYGRSFFKKNRQSVIGEGIKTTEFIIYLFSAIVMLSNYFFKEFNWSAFVLSISVIQFSYNLSRGNSKGLNNKVQILP